MTSFVYCLTCNQLEHHDHASLVFATGFKRINGVDVPLAVCQGEKRLAAETVDPVKGKRPLTHPPVVHFTA